MDKIKESIRQDILTRIHHAEIEHDVTILMAIESGSRAWGFASPDSDYDVRFIYKKNNPNYYLSLNIEDKRDVIEYPIVDEIDINGWDIRKALKLFGKSNPSFIEWLQSPITYLDDEVFRDQCLTLLPEIYSCKQGAYHYLSMAIKQYKNNLTSQQDQISLKKYLYTLRAIFSVQWIKEHQSPPPIVFKTLLDALQVDPKVKSAIEDLIDKKMHQQEKTLDKPVNEVNWFIEQSLIKMQDLKLTENKNQNQQQLLDSLFQFNVNRIGNKNSASVFRS